MFVEGSSNLVSSSLQAMESVPHRDFIAQAQTKHPSSAPAFLPLSTPLSREVRVRLNRSRRPQVGVEPILFLPLLSPSFP